MTRVNDLQPHPNPFYPRSSLNDGLFSEIPPYKLQLYTERRKRQLPQLSSVNSPQQSPSCDATNIFEYLPWHLQKSRICFGNGDAAGKTHHQILRLGHTPRQTPQHIIMPGILPMKVIKVTGTTAQTRIAQACDRCRSKKIKCDGLAPTCTQCTVVGFECKTSDKLSRRAFPRGYTESLEDRVRSLETEVKELKDLLDEKDEKIDIISKMHSQTPCSPRRPSLPESVEIAGRRASVRTDKDDVFKLQQSPFLLGGQESDAYFMGNSSGGAFIGMSSHPLALR